MVLQRQKQQTNGMERGSTERSVWGEAQRESNGTRKTVASVKQLSILAVATLHTALQKRKGN